MISALVVVAVLSQVPADAPVVVPDIKGLPAPGRIAEFEPGEVLPFRAICADQDQSRRAAMISEYHRAEAADLKQGNVILSRPRFILVVAGVALAAIAATTAVVLAAQTGKPKPP